MQLRGTLGANLLGIFAVITTVTITLVGGILILLGIYIQIPQQLPLQRIVEIAGSIAVTVALVVLYYQQKNILNDQVSLMEEEHIPQINLVEAEIVDYPKQAGGASRLKLSLSNPGKGHAENIRVEIHPTIDTEIVDPIPTFRDLERIPSPGSESFQTRGNYLSSNETEVDFWVSPSFRWEATEVAENQGSGNTAFNLIAHAAARCNGADLGLIPQLEEAEWEEIEQHIDFDRIQVQIFLHYEDTHGNEYSLKVIDRLIPIGYPEEISTLFDRGMSVAEYEMRKSRFPIDNIDPLEERVDSMLRQRDNES